MRFLVYLLALTSYLLAAPYAYITGGDDDTIVEVVDVEKDGVIKTIEVPKNPMGITVSNNGYYAYITHGKSVSIIDTVKQELVETIEVGHEVFGIDVSGDDSKLYVGNKDENTVTVIYLDDNNRQHTVTVGFNPIGIAFSNAKKEDADTNTFTSVFGESSVADEDKAYIANYGSHSVAVIDTKHDNLVKTVEGVSNPYGIAVSKNNEYFYVTDVLGDKLHVYDATTRLLKKSIAVGRQPLGVAVTKDDRYILVTNSVGNSLSVIDALTFEVVQTLDTGKFPVGVDVTLDNTKVYVVNRDSRDISIFKFAEDETSKERVFVTNGTASTIEVIFGEESSSSSVASKDDEEQEEQNDDDIFGELKLDGLAPVSFGKFIALGDGNTNSSTGVLDPVDVPSSSSSEEGTASSTSSEDSQESSASSEESQASSSSSTTLTDDDNSASSEASSSSNNQEESTSSTSSSSSDWASSSSTSTNATETEVPELDIPDDGIETGSGKEDTNSKGNKVNCDAEDNADLDECSCKDEEEMEESNSDYDFPQGLVKLVLFTDKATVKVTFEDPTGEIAAYGIYLKYGAIIPGDMTSYRWYQPNYEKVINGDGTVSFYLALEDGKLGDDTGKDGVIIDPGGPAIPVNARSSVAVPLSDSAKALMALFMLFASLYMLRRRNA